MCKDIILAIEEFNLEKFVKNYTVFFYEEDFDRTTGEDLLEDIAEIIAENEGYSFEAILQYLLDNHYSEVIDNLLEEERKEYHERCEDAREFYSEYNNVL